MFSQSDYLTILTHAPAEVVKQVAEALLDSLGDITVLVNRTGLVMLPYTDTAKGTRFHLGEVLVSETRVRISAGTEGYAACMGRDLEQSMAIALIDAALQAQIETMRLETFISEQQAAQQAADDLLLRQVEATRVELETF
ncbi:MAG: phosphonate C-P lyase system protein PhnG [Chloroflexota bacterium]|nr:phosphonate C-P lyase system protein PhnG [Chloroflexota bacterium]